MCLNVYIFEIYLNISIYVCVYVYIFEMCLNIFVYMCVYMYIYLKYIVLNSRFRVSLKHDNIFTRSAQAAHARENFQTKIYKVINKG